MPNNSPSSSPAMAVTTVAAMVARTLAATIAPTSAARYTSPHPMPAPSISSCCIAGSPLGGAAAASACETGPTCTVSTCQISTIVATRTPTTSAARGAIQPVRRPSETPASTITRSPASCVQPLVGRRHTASHKSGETIASGSAQRRTCKTASSASGGTASAARSVTAPTAPGMAPSAMTPPPIATRGSRPSSGCRGIRGSSPGSRTSGITAACRSTSTA